MPRVKSPAPNTEASLKLIAPLPGDDLPEATRLAASILATMLYPLPEDHLLKRVATAYTLALRHETMFSGQSDSDPAAWAADHVATRGQLLQVFRFFDLSSKDEVLNQMARGQVAGDLLRLMVWMHLENPRKVSLKRGMYLAEQIYRFRAVAGDGESKRLSKSTLKRIWDEFSTVSHLWAGYLELRHGHERAAEANGESAAEGVRSASMAILRDPGPLIAISINYLNCINQCIPAQQKVPLPIVQWQEVWLPPHATIPTEQPDFFDPAKLYTGLSDEAAAALEAYRRE